MTSIQRTRHWVISALIVILVAGLISCTPDHPQSTFDAVGDVAKRQLNLFMWIFWAAVIVFIIVEGALIYIVFRYRRRPGDGLPKQTHGNTKIEIAWTLAPAIVLAVVAVPTVTTLIDLSGAPPDNALHVRAIGHQWWFEFEYPEQGVTTANELHVPVGRPVRVTLESKDVIHSFWIPKVVGKVDMVPNHVNRLPTFIIPEDSPGMYLGQCAELCGTAHALMKFRVIAETPEEFENWVQLQNEPGKPPSTELQQMGYDLFIGKGSCLACHTIEGTIAQSKTGPDLTHFGSRTSLGAGVVENTPDNLALWLDHPDNLKPGTIMASNAMIYRDPSQGLTDSEIESLVAYLKGLK